MSKKPVTDTRKKPAYPAATPAPSTPAVVAAAPTTPAPAAPAPKVAKPLIADVDGQKRIIIEGVTQQIENEAAQKRAKLWKVRRHEGF